MLFKNRDKFDLVAICDEASLSVGDSHALMSLMCAIYETAFTKYLRNMPMLLVGGMQAWKAEFPTEIVHGSTETTLETSGPATNIYSTIDSSPGINGFMSPLPNGAMSPMIPLPLPPGSSPATHIRIPAESSTSALFSPPLQDAAGFGRTKSGSEVSPEPGEYKMWVPPPGASTPTPDILPPALR